MFKKKEKHIWYSGQESTLPILFNINVVGRLEAIDGELSI